MVTQFLIYTINFETFNFLFRHWKTKILSHYIMYKYFFWYTINFQIYFRSSFVWNYCSFFSSPTNYFTTIMRNFAMLVASVNMFPNLLSILISFVCISSYFVKSFDLIII